MMSRSYKRRNKQRLDALLVLVFLVIYLEIIHRGYFLLYLLATIVLILVYKLFVKFKTYIRINNPKLKYIDGMTGLEFEKCVANLLRSQGYRHVTITERYDYGVDIIAEKDEIRWGVQVKRNSNLVKAIAVRQVVTALKKYKCDRAMVVTNNKFSHVAEELARSNDCILIDRTKLYKWVRTAN